MLFVDVLFLLVFVGDVFVQMNTGYIIRGAIVTAKERVIGRYIR